MRSGPISARGGGAVTGHALFIPAPRLAWNALPLVRPAGPEPAGALAQPQLDRNHLARLLIGSVVQLLQRPGHHPPGDVVDRDGHAGQPRVHQAGRGAAVEAGDGEVLADPQPEFRGHAVDHPGEPVAAGHDGIRPQLGPAGGQQRPDLPAGAGVVHQQHVRLVGGDPAGDQPVPEPGGPLGVPVVRRPVAQEGDSPNPLASTCSTAKALAARLSMSTQCLRQRRTGPAERTRTACRPRPAASPADLPAAARRAGRRPRSGWRSGGVSRPAGPRPARRSPCCSSAARSPPPATGGTAA